MDFTFEGILKRVLGSVPNHLDKREGSVIYDAVAPCCYELSYMFEEIKRILTITFPDTSYDEYLTRRCGEFGVFRKEKTKAARLLIAYGKNDMLINVSIGERFFADDLIFTITEKRDDGAYIAECSEGGAIGNKTIESVTAVKEITGLVRCEIKDVLVPGQEEETDEALLLRYKAKIKETPYGGNISDYRQKIEAIQGVYKTLIVPVHNGGGTVKAVVMDSELNVPTNELISKIEEIIDPVDKKGLGYGLAPIGHRVTIAGVTPLYVNISTKISLKEGYGMSIVKDRITEALGGYFIDNRKLFGGSEETTIRLSLIEAIIVSCEGVLDVFDTTINGNTKNIVIGPTGAAFLGSLDIYS